MPIQNWYNLNANRAYPLDEAATGLSNDGQLLPFGILADCMLRFPNTLGRYAYVSAISVSARLVTICFSATNRPPGLIDSVTPEPEPAAAAALLATLTLPTPVQEARHYTLNPEQLGVAGWVVFGSNLRGLVYRGLFAAAQQSGLLARCGRSYTPSAVTSLTKAGTTDTLQGLIDLVAGKDISITREDVTIGPNVRDSLVFRLQSAADYNVFQIYAGPCSGRPESGTCNAEGVQTIAGVTPACGGDILLRYEFLGVEVLPNTVQDNVLLVVSYLQDDPEEPNEFRGGVVYDFPFGFEQTCTEQGNLPDSNGMLPGTYESTCPVSSSIVLEEEVPPDPAWPADLRDPEISSGGADFTGSIENMSVVSGSFSDGPTETGWRATGIGRLNIAVFRPVLYSRCFEEIINLRLTMVVSLQQGLKRNAGLLFYVMPRFDLVLSPYLRYYVAYIDHNTDTFGLKLHRMPGPLFPEPAMMDGYPLAIHPAGLLLDTRYELIIELRCSNSLDIIINKPLIRLNMYLKDPDSNHIYHQLETAVLDPYYSVDGVRTGSASTAELDVVQMGLYADQSQPSFVSISFDETVGGD